MDRRDDNMGRFDDIPDEYQKMFIEWMPVIEASRNDLIKEIAEYVKEYPTEQIVMWERPGGPPGNGTRKVTHEVLSNAILKRFLNDNPN